MCFKYEPLADPQRYVRLLRLKGGPSDTPLDLHLSACALDSAPPFSAISYTWGTEDGRELLINGAPFPVRENCYYAIWQVRLHHEDVFIWIDSICINQKDREEKGHQVSQMWNIYSKASAVLSCVGPHSHGSETFKHFADKFPSAAEQELALQDPKSRGSDHIVWKKILGRKNLKEVEQLAQHCLNMYDFGCRPYWTRMWILQEVVAGRDHCKNLHVYCGEDAFTWHAVELLWLLAEVLLGVRAVQPIFRRLAGERWHSVQFGLIDSRNAAAGSPYIRMKYTTSFGELDLSDIFSYFGEFKCSNPLDKLYGALHMIDWPDEQEPIFPDYERSVFDLALDLCRYLRLDEVCDMVKAFQIHDRHPDLQRLVSSRSHADTETIASSSLETPLSRSYVWQSANAAFIVGLEDAQGSYHMPFPMPDRMRSPMDIDISAINWNGSLPRVVAEGDELIALVCKEARVGDVLLRIMLNYPILLVLRPMYGNTCDVVGQALELDNFEDHAVGQRLSGMWERRFRDGNLLVTSEFSAEDMLLLAGQGLSPDVGRGPYYDPITLLKRLVTAPVASPRQAVAIETIEHYDDEEWAIVDAECGCLTQRSSAIQMDSTAARHQMAQAERARDPSRLGSDHGKDWHTDGSPFGESGRLLLRSTINPTLDPHLAIHTDS